MIFPDCVRHDGMFPVYGVAVGGIRWPDRYHPAPGVAGECVLVRRVTLKVCAPPDTALVTGGEQKEAEVEVWECRAE